MVTPSKSKKPALQDQDSGLLPPPSATQHHYHQHQNSIFVSNQQCHHHGHTLQVEKASPPRPRPWPTTASTAQQHIFSTTNTTFIINNATIMVASSRPKTQSSKTPPNTPLQHQTSWSRIHIQKHIEERKHSAKEIIQRLAKHYELGKLCLKWNDFQEKILASFQELRYDKEFT